ncbi:MAG: hypothetical protein COW63_12840 [Bacteroidetes bacterium CG18_big_fil_WC_8_21_14_2_50_41_14]|nr:MAG: hypothetical protein COW63_12840 [Bacteroidetes bacterium CG18_big_fil_WC_8_21_14_2_50_41_14]PIY34571.1 MAG: hypothetical protein COZ08_01185 [Bacteroidetes bacterium CG_4_10_14_3_um_filter_42_6]PJB59471.1 MAG: hypothetical protein CO098_03230 [Bacteroidetes bacterium CG_4_9_14_3_um_filter_41_19]
MKSRIATLLMLCVLFSATVFAIEPIPASKATRDSVVDMVKKSLKYPEFAIKNKLECCVLVSMIIQDDGTLKVDASNSLSPQLQDYVINTIENIKNDHLAKSSGQRVLVKVKFELIA